jgi:hypothetical protein
MKELKYIYIIKEFGLEINPGRNQLDLYVTSETWKSH